MKGNVYKPSSDFAFERIKTTLINTTAQQNDKRRIP